MTALTDLLSEGRLVKMLGAGEPGSGKTGSLACLINTGKYKLRVIDLDGHFDQSIAPFVKPEFAGNVDVFRLEDKLRLFGPNSSSIITAGRPQIVIRVLQLLDHWKYTDEKGREIDLGKPHIWGGDTVLVLDSLSALNYAAMQHAIFAADRNEKGPRRKEWGSAAAMERGIIMNLCSAFNSHHVIVFSHVRLVGPDEPEDDTIKADSEVTAEKRRLTIARNEFIEWRETPSAVGKQLSRDLAQHFPIYVEYKSETKGLDTKHFINFRPTSTMNCKVPALDIPRSLPAETGLLWLFDAITGQGKPSVATNKE